MKQGVAVVWCEENLSMSAEISVVLKWLFLLFGVEAEGCGVLVFFFCFLYSTVEAWSVLNAHRIVSSSLLIV